MAKLKKTNFNNVYYFIRRCLFKSLWYIYIKELAKNHNVNYLKNFSLKMIHTDSLNNINTNIRNEEQDSEADNKGMNYNIELTKDFKNLNKLLAIKGVNSANSLSINNIKYLIFSLTANQASNGKIYDQTYKMDLYFSLKFVVKNFQNNSEDQNKKII